MFHRTHRLVHAAIAAGFVCSLSGQAGAAPLVFAGTDVNNSTVNADAAFAGWSASIGATFALDNLDGIAGADDGATLRTTDLGNAFSTAPGDDVLGVGNFTTNVLEGVFLRITQGADALTSFEWNLVVPADAFGFFARDNDGGIVTVGFDDGTSQTFGIDSRGANDNLFWGVSGLASGVTTVSISSTDPDATSGAHNSNWDRFVYRAAAAPEPTVLGLLALGAAGMCGAGARRRRQSREPRRSAS